MNLRWDQKVLIPGVFQQLLHPLITHRIVILREGWKKGAQRDFFNYPAAYFWRFFFQDQLNAKKFMECSNRVNYHHKLTNLPMTIIDIPLCPSSVPKNLFGVSCTNGQQTTENNIPQNFFFAVHKSLGYFFLYSEHQ